MDSPLSHFELCKTVAQDVIQIWIHTSIPCIDEKSVVYKVQRLLKTAKVVSPKMNSVHFGGKLPDSFYMERASLSHVSGIRLSDFKLQNLQSCSGYFYKEQVLLAFQMIKTKMMVNVVDFFSNRNWNFFAMRTHH